MPESLLAVFETNKTVVKLLESYGKVFCDSLTKQSNERDVHNTGTVLLQEGSTVHAGPRCTGPRVIMFFSGTPKGQKAYNPNVQYSASTLLCEMIRHVWNDVDTPSRVFLLAKVAYYAKQSKLDGLSERLSGNPVSEFCKLLEGKKRSLKTAIAQFLLDFPTFPQPVIASVQGLQTADFDLGQGASKARKITIYDKMEMDDDDEPMGKYEGKLVMNDDAKWELFDGTNGKVYDYDGVEFKCFVSEDGDTKFTPSKITS